MDALVRVLARLQDVKSDVEMRFTLDKFVSWMHRCFDLTFLRLAKRDYEVTIAAKKSAFQAKNIWPHDVDVKSQFVLQKLEQLIGEFSAQQRTPGGQAADQSATEESKAKDGEGDKESAEARQQATEQAYEALKAQIFKKNSGEGADAAKPTGSGKETSKKKKQGLFVDLSLVNSTPKAKEAKKRAKKATASSAGDTKSSAVEKTSGAADSSPTSVTKTSAAVAPAASAGAGASQVSPRLAQQLYDTDLSSRSCVVGADDGEEKFYFPLKLVAKIMRRALPGGEDLAKRKKGKDADKDDDNTQNQDDDDDLEAKADDEDNQTKTPMTRAEKASQIKIDDAAATLMQECATEFLLYLTSEARDYSMLDKRKTTIMGSHVVDATRNLGFTTYNRVLDVYNDKIKKLQDELLQKKQEKKLLAKQEHQKQQQLQLQQQQQLLEQAKQQAQAQEEANSSDNQQSTTAATRASEAATTEVDSSTREVTTGAPQSSADPVPIADLKPEPAPAVTAVAAPVTPSPQP
ncbi:TPA: hypothetical protein N0F65_008890 [Lagenidium giganteum]|uniref:Transcription factor CBF/NF-Y/archaeal histone domain-containing protein n=1 Tax=Lagenidium giganteum TaxID=4803 RepID=A0AAV2YXZ5_9STRA|nr:TPA: hypothetical protein N0F65_008890 [Lagenidium giganteum]